jgi:hypothetical protein
MLPAKSFMAVSMPSRDLPRVIVQFGLKGGSLSALSAPHVKNLLLLSEEQVRSSTQRRRCRRLTRVIPAVPSPISARSASTTTAEPSRHVHR